MYYAPTFRLERIGSVAIVWQGTTVTLSAGRYCHVNIAAYDGATQSFAEVLEAALVTAGYASATVSYSTSSHAYTLSNGGGSFTVSFPATDAGRLMARILGRSTGATSASIVSDVRPYYVLVTEIDGRSRYTGLRHEARFVRRQSDDGIGYALGPSTEVVTGQWEHWHEPLAAVFRYAATSSAPWTWEHFWLHAGRWQELIYVVPPSDDPEGAAVWQLIRPDFDDSTHERQFADGDFAWKVRVSAVRLGGIDVPDNALLTESDDPILTEVGGYLTTE